MKQKQPIRKMTLPTYVKEAYSDSDRLLVQDLLIKEESQLERLKEIGVAYYIPGESKKETELTIFQEDVDEDIDPPEREDLTQIGKNRRKFSETIRTMKASFAKISDREIDFTELHDKLDESINFFTDQAKEKPECIAALTQLETYDDDTYQHSLNVCLLAILYGKYRGFTDDELKSLAFGALLNDIGKIAIPDDIVRKNGKLGKKEWEIIKHHPQHGYDLIKDFEPEDIVKNVVLEHHERPDGSGYPDGKIKIHPYSRIVSVCDVYEALTAKRVYKESLDPLRAFIVLKDEFMEFPETKKVVSGLVNSMGIYPVGSWVQLSNGETAIIKRNHPDNLRRPTVVIVQDKNGRPVLSPVTLNLERLSTVKKGGPHGEIYDSSLEVDRIVHVDKITGDRSQVAKLIEKKEFIPI